MNFSLIIPVVLVLVVDLAQQVKCQVARIQNTTIEEYPFHAYVDDGRVGCTGILISKYHVITPASCVYQSTDVMVYLGLNICPYGQPYREEVEQAISVSKIMIHEKFNAANDADDRWFNDIALLKLATGATMSNKIQPAILGSTNTFEAAVSVTGWVHNIASNLGIMQVYILSPATCRNFVFTLHDQEFCLKWPDTQEKLNLAGNPISLNGKIIGFLKSNLLHQEANEETLSVELNLSRFLDWISDKTDLGVNEQLSAHKKTRELEECALRTEKLEDSQSTLMRQVANLVEELQSTKAEIANLTQEINYINNLLNVDPEAA